MRSAETKDEKKQRKVEKRTAKIQKKQAKLESAGKFKLWRNRRPFWGATLAALAGLLILYIPIQLYAIAFIPGSFAFIGLLFGGLVLILGILAYIYPQFSTVLGVMTIFLSVLSIMGALGGFLFGTIFGIIGGALCIGWEEQGTLTHTNDRDHKEKSNRIWRRKSKKIDTGKNTGTSTATSNTPL